MIVWRELGILVVVFLVGPLFATYAAPKGWENGVVAVAYVVSAVGCWFLGRALNRGLFEADDRAPRGWLGRIVDDGVRDRELRSMTPWSSFLMVKFEYWAIPLVGIAITFGVLQLVA